MQQEKLIQLIKKEMKDHPISFARFMELALYAPKLGYYASRKNPFGKQGDFVTAPLISPLFTHCVAQQFKQILVNLEQANILEIGAGSGIFAKDVLTELKKQDALPQKYFIFELSDALRLQQRERFEKECPEFLSRIYWLDSLENFSLSGIIFANEVLDAMPVHRFEWRSGVLQECAVDFKDNQFVWSLISPSEKLIARWENISTSVDLPDFYRSEMNFFQGNFIDKLAKVLQKGVILLIDYGYGRSEYYHPERINGTLTCFFQHHYHDDPFLQVGLQDITSHVDFTYIAESAALSGLDVKGFTSQAAFLLSCGLLDFAKSNNLIDQFNETQAIKKLTLPSEMGEVVKVMALTKDFDESLVGFQLQDRRRDL